MSRGHIQLTRTERVPAVVTYDVTTREYTYDGSKVRIGQLSLFPKEGKYKFEPKGNFALEPFWPPEFFALDPGEQARLARSEYRDRTHRTLMRKIHIAATVLLEGQLFPESYGA